MSNIIPNISHFVYVSYLKHQEYLIKVGEKVKSVREEKGISQYELSYKTDISRNQIGRIERGEINTSLSALYEIANGLEVNLIDLLPKDD